MDEPQVMMDYTPHYLQAKRELQLVHLAMLSRNYELASKTALEVIADMKLVYAAIKHEEEQHAARSQQQTKD